VGERIVESEVTMDCNKLQSGVLVYFKLICLIVTTHLNGVSQARVKQKIQEFQES
jgi:hypothetical protein